MKNTIVSAGIRLARPHQYLKNGFIWLPILFGNQLTQPRAVGLTFLAFASFSLMASAVYAINDIKDMDDDRRHPVKRRRPVASGEVSPATAVSIALVLFIVSVAVAVVGLSLECLFVLLAYLLLNVAYTHGLKHMPIVDIVCIALGFVLRILIGGMAARIPISPWIVIVTFLLALFLALAKRRDDLLLADQDHPLRKAMDGYNLAFISLAMGIMASVIIVAYILYTVSPDVVAKHGTKHLYLTSLWVLLGLLRYLQITFVEEKSGSPTQVLIHDPMMKVVIVLWLVNIMILLYA